MVSEGTNRLLQVRAVCRVRGGGGGACTRENFKFKVYEIPFPGLWGMILQNSDFQPEGTHLGHWD